MLIGHSNLKKRDLVVEIGAGSGVITSALSARVRQVVAIEPDHATAAKLRENLGKRGIKNVTVVEKDFMDYELPSEPYKVFSNPPLTFVKLFRFHSETIFMHPPEGPVSIH